MIVRSQKLDQSTKENKTELEEEFLVNVGTQLPRISQIQISDFPEPPYLHRKTSVETQTN